MAEIRVRSCELRDAEALLRLIAGFRDHLRDASPTDDQIRAQLPLALADPAVEFACAWLEGVPVGYSQTRFVTSVWVPGLEAHLEDLFTTAAARRRSVGRLLLRHALERARLRGAARLALTTNEENTAAQALYRSEGLTPESHRLYPDSREVLWSVRVRAQGPPPARGGDEPQVRRATPGDERLWRDAVASILAEEDREGRLVTHAEIRAALADPRCQLFLAVSGERPVGLLSAYLVPDVAAGGRQAYLYDIEVRAADRRRGVGKALVDALVASCRAEGVRTIWAGTDVDNRAARRTFEGTGAELVGDAYAEYEWELE